MTYLVHATLTEPRTPPRDWVFDYDDVDDTLRFSSLARFTIRAGGSVLLRPHEGDATLKPFRLDAIHLDGHAERFDVQAVNYDSAKERVRALWRRRHPGVKYRRILGVKASAT